MREGFWRGAPALAIAGVALFVSMGGSVYAAKKAKLDGRTIKAKSLPGNRLKPGSVPANRLKANVLADLLPGGQITGADVNEMSLDQVPSAVHAEWADTARSAVDADTALNAVNAVDSKTVNGHSAGCMPGTVAFAGACWEASSRAPATAPNAARHCAAVGGALPEALQLAAFAEEAGVAINSGGEWSGEIGSVSGVNLFSVIYISPSSDVDYSLASSTRSFRCVIPLLR